MGQAPLCLRGCAKPCMSTLTDPCSLDCNVEVGIKQMVTHYFLRVENVPTQEAVRAYNSTWGSHKQKISLGKGSPETWFGSDQGERLWMLHSGVCKGPETLKSRACLRT